MGRATFILDGLREAGIIISIHALRGEGDGLKIFIKVVLKYFNPRPPWGGRLFDPVRISELGRFQSTPSVGRATGRGNRTNTITPFQSTPSVGRATTAVDNSIRPRVIISIHALRGEGDNYRNVRHRHGCISIHALRGEGDETVEIPTSYLKDFNPRPPWGGRRYRPESRGSSSHFNPRPPWGGRPGGICKKLGEIENFNPRPPWGGRLYVL